MSRNSNSPPVATGISGLHSRFNRGVRPHLEWQQSTPLSFRVATGISWSPLCDLKGVKPPLEFSERTRDCPLGPTGKEGPHLTMKEESRDFFRAVADVWVFYRLTTGNSGSFFCGPREVQSPFGMRGGAQDCSRITAGDTGLKTH